MQTSAFPTLRDSQNTANSGYFRTHPVGEIVRSLFLSSLLWIFLAIALYTVYTMVAGAA
jgi:hypothetical protein